MSDEDQQKWNSILEYMNETSLNTYQKALNSGMAPEQARLFLPAYGMYVRWRWTASLAAVIHFLQQRLEHDAQMEIQNYALGVSILTQQHYPHVFKALEL